MTCGNTKGKLNSNPSGLYCLTNVNFIKSNATVHFKCLVSSNLLKWPLGLVFLPSGPSGTGMGTASRSWNWKWNGNGTISIVKQIEVFFYNLNFMIKYNKLMEHAITLKLGSLCQQGSVYILLIDNV